jgi:hypothetical protein
VACHAVSRSETKALLHGTPNGIRTNFDFPTDTGHERRRTGQPWTRRCKLRTATELRATRRPPPMSDCGQTRTARTHRRTPCRPQLAPKELPHPIIHANTGT